MLGGQVICEISGSGVWQKGYVYLGGQMLAMQQSGTVTYVHQDPVTKSQRMTDTAGTVVANATIELDPFGGETNRTSNNRQSHVFTSYERDAAGMDEAGARKYHGWWSRFDQPDPYDGSYNMADPQSFNRYSYVQNDPVNFVDPSGLNMAIGEKCITLEIPDNEGHWYTKTYCSEYVYSDGAGHWQPPDDFGGPPNSAPMAMTGQGFKGGMEGKKQRCANAVQQAQNARQAISTRIQNAIRVGGLDRTHQISIEQSLNSLKNAVADIAKNCFDKGDGPGGTPLFPEFESSIRLSQQAANEFKVPPVGFDGGRTAAERRIIGGTMLGVIGGAISGAAYSVWNAARWVFGY